jgi:hypothetical protein
MRINVHIKDKDQSQSIKYALQTYHEVQKCVHELLFDDSDVYRSPLSNNIRLSHSITPTDIIVQMQ